MIYVVIFTTCIIVLSIYSGKVQYPNRRHRLLNMRTGEVIEITSNQAELDCVVNILVEEFLLAEPEITDEQLVEL